MRIFLIRHGESLWQVRKSTSSNSSLTNVGIKQSNYLNNYLNSLTEIYKGNFGIYVSPLKRVIQTISSLKRSYQINNNLVEPNFHVAKGLPTFDKPSIYKRKLSNDLSYNKFKKNIKEELEKFLLAKHDNILVYAHGGVIKTILRIIHDNDSICYTINNCSITEINWYRSRWHINKLNKTTHLPKEYIT